LIALWYISPHVAGVKFHGDIWGLIVASLIFNAAFWGLECLLAVVVFGINIGTLGLGAFITGSLKFAAALLSPSIALVGTAQLVPNFLQVNSLFPGALVFGLMLGGLLWASIPDKQKSG
jgi:hypothetical protein